MELYRITFKPLEPYTFGTDQGAAFEGVNATGYESYIMTSNKMPEQTTILGTLRYMVLRANGALKTDFVYEKGQEDKIVKLIGESSFSFLKDSQDYGLIKSISPVFIWNFKDKETYIRNPLCNVEKNEGYESINLEENAVITSKGNLRVPISNEKGFIAKDGFKGGFIGIRNKKLVGEDTIFKSVVISGNQSGERSQNMDGGFYKREIKSLNNDYAFAVYVVADKSAFGKGQQIVFMGRKNAAFEVGIEAIEEVEKNEDGYAGNYLKKQVEEKFKDFSDEIWYCALSDIYSNEVIDFRGLALINDKHIRNLETNIAEGTYSKKRTRTERFNLISAGSCFFENEPEIKEQNNCINVGYNILFKIGGTV